MNNNFKSINYNLEKSKKFTSPTWKKMIELSNFAKSIQDIDKLKNFRRNISVGLDNSNNLRNKEIYNTNDLPILLNKIKKIINKNNFELLEDTKFGNPLCFTDKKDKVYTFSSIEFALYFNYLETKINFKKLNSILEIGGGLGMLARNIKIKYPHIKYYNIDLPHSNFIFKRHLANYFKNFKFNEDFSKNDEVLDFNLLQPWEISLIKKNSIDLIINMRSFMEMDIEICNFYLDTMRNIMKINTKFVSINRLEKQNKKRNDNLFLFEKLNLLNFRIKRLRIDFFKKNILILIFQYNPKYKNEKYKIKIIKFLHKILKKFTGPTLLKN